MPLAETDLAKTGLANDQALADVRVLELCQMVAGPYCGKLLADLGAEVVKVEPPGGGDAARHCGPFVAGEPHPERSLLFLYLNTNKMSITLDLTSQQGQGVLEHLVSEADIIIEDLAQRQAEKLGLEYSRFERINPSLVMTSISTFGRTGPYRDFKAYPLNTFHAGGEGYLTPTGAQYLDRPPVRVGRFVGEYAAGISAAVATLAALSWQRISGRGQHIDVSKQESLISLNPLELNHYPNLGLVASRASRVAAFGGIMPCRDGYVEVSIYEEREWQALAKLMGDPAWMAEERFQGKAAHAAQGQEINRFIAVWTKERSKAEIVERAQALGCPIAPYNTTKEVFESKQMRARGFFNQIQHPVAGSFAYPAAPYRFSTTPWKVRRPAPLLGQDNQIICPRALERASGERLRPPPGTRVVSEATVHKQPLAGVRVVDLSWAIAGPFATTLLSYFGAEVIKVESRRRLDVTRTVVHPLTKKVCHPDESLTHYYFNSNKLSLTLNLRHPAAREVVKELVKVSDVVVESFRPGVLGRLGLDYPALSILRPDLVMLSTTTMGQSGPEAQAAGYAPLFAAAAGLGELTGYPDSPPSQLRLTVDALSAITNAFAILAALHYRNRAGKGQYIDASSTEAIASLVADSLLDYAANGRIQRRSANRDEAMAPHNCFRCKGEDRWISIVVSTEEEWQALRQAMGNPEWAREEKFATASARWTHQEELERNIETWTVQYDPYELMHQLQAAGVAAVPSFTSQDLFTDPHLLERGFAHVVEQPGLGPNIILSPPWRLSATPARIARRAPFLGENNQYLLLGCLGVSDKEVRRLEKDGALQ